jgi:hypothetical protein
MDGITNKVTASGLVTIDLEAYYPAEEIAVIDIKDQLYQGLILREKDFREFVKNHDWSSFTGKLATITCSADAIVPTWAYMLVSLALEPFAKKIFFGTAAEALNYFFTERLASINPSDYKDARVVIKGCSDRQVPVNAFVTLTAMLKPHVKSIMYGEPCSTVPLYKAPR